MIFNNSGDFKINHQKKINDSKISQLKQFQQIEWLWNKSN